MLSTSFNARGAFFACTWAAVTLAPSIDLHAQASPPPSHWDYVSVSSGTLDNPNPVEGVVWRDFVTVPAGTPWVRLFFTRTRLDKGSYVRLVSMRDGDFMTLHQEHLEQWSYSSAFFNGHSMMVELIAGPDTRGNRVEIDRVLAGDINPPAPPPQICGPFDDRQPAPTLISPAIGRIFPAGCTGWIIDEPNPVDKCHLSAGHCRPTNYYAIPQVLQFNVPLSAANCAPNQPAAMFQFAIIGPGSRALAAGPGADYWVFWCAPNWLTGLTTFQTQGVALPLAPLPMMPPNGRVLEVHGYGVDGTDFTPAPGANANCTCVHGSGTGSWNRTLQWDWGQLVASVGNQLDYRIDTCGGNSGSPVFDPVTRLAVGIHGHGGCAAAAGVNFGTKVTHPGLLADITACCWPGGARQTPYGQGCVGSYASFYEWFETTAAIDLSHSAFTMTPAANGYVTGRSAVAFVPPSGSATNLGLGDDTEVTVALSSAFPYPGGTTGSLNVCSNGHVSTASSGAAGDYTPTPGELLNWPNATWAVWRDLFPGPGGGTVWYEEAGSRSIVTWLGVVGYSGYIAGTTPSTFQIQFDRASGQVHFVFESLDTVSISSWAGGEGWVLGFSPGGPSLDRRSQDLSLQFASGPIVTNAPEVAPLSLGASAPPVVNTVIDLVTSNITPTTLFGGVMLGLTRFAPPIDLTGIGMPGCFQYSDNLAVHIFISFGSSNSTPVLIPPFVGLAVYAQSVTFDPAAGLTQLGALTSNGLELLIY